MKFAISLKQRLHLCFFLQEELDKGVLTPFSLTALFFKHSYAYPNDVWEAH